MDNNQQDATPAQPASSDKVTEAVGPTNADNQSFTNRALWDNGYDVQNIGINEPTTMTGNSVQSPFSGQDVSMTSGQPFGGPIVSTEVEPNVRNEAGPY